jgi:hypothetical protein
MAIQVEEVATIMVGMEAQLLLEMVVVLLVVTVEIEEMAEMLMEGMVEVCVLNG